MASGLPFLNPRNIASGIISKHVPSGNEATVRPEDDRREEKDSGLTAAAEALLGAIERKSATEVADAFHRMFLEYEKMPHDEVSHEEGEDES